MPGNEFNPNNIDHRERLVAWIEAAFVQDETKIPKEGLLSITSLNNLRNELLDQEVALGPEQEALASALWSSKQRIDQYVKRPVSAPQTTEFRVSPFWSPFEPQSRTVEHDPQQGMSRDKSFNSVEAGSESQVTFSSGEHISINEADRYRGRTYEGTIKRTIRKALQRLSKPTAHEWDWSKIDELSSLLEMKAPWKISLSFIELAIEALDLAYNRWPVNPRPQPKSISLVNEMIVWLRGLSYQLSSQSAIEAVPVVAASDLFIQYVPTSAGVATKPEPLQVEQVLRALTLIVEETEHIAYKELLSNLEAWWQVNHTSAGEVQYTRDLQRAEHAIAEWKSGALRVSLPPSQEVHSSGLDYSILEESAYILRSQLERGDQDLPNTLQQLDPALAESFDQSIEALEDFAVDNPSLDKWKHWIAQRPELSSIVLVLAENSRNPHAQLILQEISPHVSEWTLARLSVLQDSTFGTGLWEVEAIKGQAADLYAECFLLDNHAIQQRAVELLTDSALMSAFEAAAIPVEEALQILEEAIVELGHWPSAKGVNQAAALPLQEAQVVAVSEALTLVEFSRASDPALSSSIEMEKDAWKQFLEDWKQRTDPTRWTSQHNQRLQQVLELILEAKAIKDEAAREVLAKVISDLKLQQQLNHKEPEANRQALAAETDLALQGVMRRRLENIRQKKILRLQSAWDLYENVRDSSHRTSGTNHFKLMRARRFIEALEALWQVRHQETTSYDFRTWLQGVSLGSPLERQLETELKDLLGSSMSYRKLRKAITHSIGRGDLSTSGLISEANAVEDNTPLASRGRRVRGSEMRAIEAGRVRSGVTSEAESRKILSRAERLRAAQRSARERMRSEIPGDISGRVFTK
ncbi:MAG: hypothetical protein H7A32_03560 [Deltaproteobacteria bacterium]|nr:hypothetical protein [Deltaproteobacteria bacterium]